MSALLDAYLDLERLMLELDERGDPGADRVRDLMDPLWYQLGDEDHAHLDTRGLVSLASLHPIRLPAGTGLHYCSAPAPGAIRDRRDRNCPIGLLVDWGEEAA